MSENHLGRPIFGSMTKVFFRSVQSTVNENIERLGM